MWHRTAGKIVITIITLLFMVLAIISILVTDEDASYHGFQAVALAILAVASALTYRYFED